MSATGRPAEAGWTLIEMLVVIGILGLISGLVFPSLQGPLQRAQLQSARSELVTNLRMARAGAVRQGHSVAVDISADGRGYGWGQTSVVLPAGLRALSDERAVRFFGDGSSTGGELEIVGRGQSLRVVIDPVTGVVSPGSAG
jgi:general secretion pathway protein H